MILAKETCKDGPSCVILTKEGCKDPVDMFPLRQTLKTKSLDVSVTLVSTTPYVGSGDVLVTVHVFLLHLARVNGSELGTFNGVSPETPAPQMTLSFS